MMHDTTRYLLSLLLLLALCANTNAQQAYLNDNAVWHEDLAFLDALISHHADFTLSLGGDTVISGHTYKKIRQLGTDTVRQLGSTEPPSIVPLDRYLGGIREDVALSEWWVVFSGLTFEERLYDFDLSLGQTISGTFGDCSEPLQVSSIDSVQVAGAWRQRFHFTPWDHYIIEGVGANSGLFGHLCHFIEEYGCLNTFALGDDELVVNGCDLLPTAITVHHSADHLSAPFPNPAVDRVALGSDLVGLSIQIHDGAGRIVSTQRAGSGGTVDLGTLPVGLYVLRSGHRTFRVVKE